MKRYKKKLEISKSTIVPGHETPVRRSRVTLQSVAWTADTIEIYRVYELEMNHRGNCIQAARTVFGLFRIQI